SDVPGGGRWSGTEPVIILVLVVPLLFAGLLMAGRRTFGSGRSRLPRRLGPFVGGLGVVAVVFALISGLEEPRGATPLFGLLVLVPVAGLVLFLARREQPVAERAWSGPAVALAGVGAGRADGSAVPIGPSV